MALLIFELMPFIGCRLSRDDDEELDDFGEELADFGEGPCDSGGEGEKTIIR